jgi:NAD(P)H dehydrogenase (quinone)
MSVLVVVCHPSRKSYTFQVLEQLQRELVNKGITVEVSDLYAIDFKSDMSGEEYEREGFSRKEWPVPPDVIQEHEKIQRADCVIFLYPVWWSDCPAKLKGWFDRVFTVGFAYKPDEHVTSMKTMKYGVAVCTAGYTNEYLVETGIAQSMENIMLRDRFGQRFAQKEMVILGGTLNLDSVKSRHEEQISLVVTRIQRYVGQ